MAWAAAPASCCPGKAPCALAYTAWSKVRRAAASLGRRCRAEETTEATNQRAALPTLRRFAPGKHVGKQESSCFRFFAARPPPRPPPPSPHAYYNLNVIPKTGPNRQTRACARTTQSGHSNPNRNSSCTPALAGCSARADSQVLRVEARAEGGSRPGARPLPLSPAPPD